MNPAVMFTQEMFAQSAEGMISAEVGLGFGNPVSRRMAQPAPRFVRKLVVKIDTFEEFLIRQYPLMKQDENLSAQHYATKVVVFGTIKVVTIYATKIGTPELGKLILMDGETCLMVTGSRGDVLRPVNYPEWVNEILADYSAYLDDRVAAGATPWDCRHHRQFVKDLCVRGTGESVTSPSPIRERTAPEPHYRCSAIPL